MIYRIGSRTNQKIKNLLKERDKLFFFEGEKLVKDILNRDVRVSKLIVNERREKDLNILGEGVDDIWYVNEPVLRRISSLKEKTDFIAVLEIEKQKIDFDNIRVVIAMDNVQDPANAGTVFRCAAAFGIDSVVFTGSGVKPTNSKFLRAAQDSFFNVNFDNYKDIETLITKLEIRNFNIYLTSSKKTQGTIDVNQVSFPCLIILGSEGEGLNEALFKEYKSIRIPQTNKVESLNVGVCACIFMYELMNLGK